MCQLDRPELSGISSIDLGLVLIMITTCPRQTQEAARSTARDDLRTEGTHEYSTHTHTESTDRQCPNTHGYHN
jgi:hypothetical protein